MLIDGFVLRFRILFCFDVIVNYVIVCVSYEMLCVVEVGCEFEDLFYEVFDFENIFDWVFVCV